MNKKWIVHNKKNNMINTHNQIPKTLTTITLWLSAMYCKNELKTIGTLTTYY